MKNRLMEKRKEGIMLWFSESKGATEICTILEKLLRRRKLPLLSPEFLSILCEILSLYARCQSYPKYN